MTIPFPAPLSRVLFFKMFHPMLHVQRHFPLSFALSSNFLLLSCCSNDFSILHDNLLINPVLCVSIFNPFVCCDSSFVQVDIKQAYAAVITAIASITAEAGAAGIAHPERREVFLRRQGAVVVCMVTGRSC